jgi:hypothetical protein
MTGRIGTSHGEPQAFLDVSLLMETDECILWPYARNPQGYGMILHKGLVTRIVCEKVNGFPPTDKHEAAHSCGNGHLGCINKRHLSWKTRLENINDIFTLNGVHHNAKLTIEQVIEIKALENILSQVKIAKKYNVSRRTIQRIYENINWSWL